MKPQAMKLIKHLLDGGSVSRDSAWNTFGIANLTARLTEMKRMGYQFIKETQTAQTTYGKVKFTSWKFPQALKQGATVEITKDIGTMFTLKGRIGKVQRIHLENAQATIFITGIGYRRLSIHSMKEATVMSPGTPVVIVKGPLIVQAYHRELDSYTLVSPNPNHTIVASASLVGRKDTTIGNQPCGY